MKKIVLITGASAGLGKALAKLYLEKSYHLIISGRNRKGFEEFKENPNVEIVLGDITQKETRAQLVDLIKNKYKRLDILVNNAGITFIQPFNENTEDQLSKIIDTNLKAPILLTQALFGVMKEQHAGTIVFINSTAGKEGKLHHTLYSTTKFGLTGFAQSLRLEAKQFGIRVLSMHPGGVKTELYNNLSKKPDISEYMDPKKIAEIVVFLSETTELSPDDITINRLAK